jgi:hypothetical protein
MLGPSIFGALGKFLGKLLFGNTPPPSGRTPPRQPPKPPTQQQLEIMPPAYEERGLVPVSNTSQNSYAAEHSRLLGILKNELLGLKNQSAPKDGQRRRRRGKQLPPETTRQDPRPYGKRDTEQHGDLSLRYGYQDGQDVDVDSSWIGAFNFRLMGGDYGGEQDIRDIGDMTLVTLRASKNNTSGRYLYPAVPRAVMNRAMMAPSKGKFYWAVLRHYSNRMAIGQRMRRTANHLIRNPNSPHTSRRGRR